MHWLSMAIFQPLSAPSFWTSFMLPETHSTQMIAVTSHRPLKTCPLPIRRNQEAAAESWREAFTDVCYFGEQEEFYGSIGFHYIPHQEFPHISRLVEFCAQLQGWSCIVNSDIIVSPSLSGIEQRLIKANASCAVSWRWQFDQEQEQSSVVDLGMDFFAARQEVWREVALIYPEEFRIGHSSWDAIMLGAFNIVAKDQLYDLTHHRLILHPLHFDRHSPFFIANNTQTECRDNVCWPEKRLR